ncbi:MAG: sigma-54-dependent Fis family transcriptional regulator [Elusimicrobia bacterium]|nr:sigma-54-dependent Fis family transcriptional regulator [Elusimicrobiota bacterium]
MAFLLIVDDDADLRTSLSRYLAAKGHSVSQAPDAAAALASVETQPVELVFLDLSLPDADGLKVLEDIRRAEPGIPVLILTGNTEVSTAVKAMKLGASDYLLKPFSNEDLSVHLERALRERQLEREVVRLRERLTHQAGAALLCGSPAMRAVYEAVDRVAPTDLTVVLQGESGCGKEVVARLLHEKSPRREGPFLAVDSGALPEALVESELFGYEKGAFTGADRPKLGQFELAAGGTIFLDEVANLPLEAQGKLLRVLQERRIRRLGGKKDVPVDVRVVAATNRDLGAEVRAKRFREDLFHRLDQFTLNLPSMRERREDIEPLARHFLREANRQLGRRVAGFSAQALACLRRRGWPGNVREIQNVVTRAALLASERIGVEHLAAEGGGTEAPRREPVRRVPPASLSLKKASRRAAGEAEKKVILEALALTASNKARAARLLGIDRKSLYAKLRKYRLKPPTKL